MVGASSTVVAAALISTGIISLAPNVLLFLAPSYAAGSSSSSSLFLSTGQALAAGGLLGDVFLHTMPHASGKDEDAAQEAGLWILFGFASFLLVDMIIRTLEAANPADTHHHSHQHHHQQQPQVVDAATSSSKKENGGERQKQNASTLDGKSSSTTAIQLNHSAIYLNLVADALHNFTDGLAIGASYAAAEAQLHHHKSLLALLLTSRGGLASLSVLFHEIPHEIGDFCTLIRAGYSTKQAVMAQFGTAIAAFVGTVTALLVSSSSSWMGDRLVFATAGGFVYLSATTILPQVMADEAINNNHGVLMSTGMRLMQFAAFAAGIALLYLVALLEEQDDDHHHSHHHHHHQEHVVGDHDHHHHHDMAAEL